MGGLDFPPWIDVFLGVLTILGFAFAGLVGALVAAAFVGAPRGSGRRWLEHLGRSVVGPIACGATGLFYGVLGILGGLVLGERALVLLARLSFAWIAGSVSVGVTAALAIDARRRMLAAPPEASRRPLVVAAVVATVLGVGIALVGTGFDPTVAPWLVLCVASFAVLAMTVVRRSLPRPHP